MLTGRRLFRGKNDYQTIALVRACDVPSLRSYNPASPVDLENILLKALSKDIKDRYQTPTTSRTRCWTSCSRTGSRSGRGTSSTTSADPRGARGREEGVQEKKAQEERSPGGNNLIINLINEEMLHFRSLGRRGEGPRLEPVVAVGERTGSSTSGVSAGGEQVGRSKRAAARQHRENDPSRPLDVDVFTPVPGRVPLTPNKLGLSPTPVEPLPKQDSLVDELGLAKPVSLRRTRRPPKPAVMRTIPPGPADGAAAGADQQGRGRLGVAHRARGAAGRRRHRGCSLCSGC
jgi:hypothetical protein